MTQNVKALVNVCKAQLGYVISETAINFAAYKAYGTNTPIAIFSKTEDTAMLAGQNPVNVSTPEAFESFKAALLA